jgi:hypothetical protein
MWKTILISHERRLNFEVRKETSCHGPSISGISPLTFVRRASAAISIAMESSLAADAATLTSDNGSERRAVSIGEVQKMTCPRCLHTFPVEFYCIKCGCVPRARKTDDPGMFVMSDKRIEQGQINWIGNKTNALTQATSVMKLSQLPGERAPFSTLRSD